MTKQSTLVALADPAAGFMQKIRVAADTVAGYTFATGWVSSPPALSKTRTSLLGPMPVSGRGKNREQALNVLMMEAVERNSCVYLGTETLTEGRAADISAEQWRQFLPFSNRQVANRKKLPIDDPDWMGESLSSKTRIQFAEAVSLVDGKSRAIPAALVFLSYEFPSEPRYARADSNGCAAGATWDDAVTRGLLELIERDAFGIWWFNQLERHELGFGEDEELCRIAAALAEEQRTLRLIDIAHDLGTPVVAAVNADQNGERIYIGCAAGASEASAAHKAALEAVGFWLWGKLSADSPSRKLWLEEGSLEKQPFLKPSQSRPMAPDKDAEPANVASFVSRLSAAGFEPLVVDLTKPYFGIPVVRVIAPGLRSHLRRFSPGRLYDVPVKMGLLSRVRSEDELLRYRCPL